MILIIVLVLVLAVVFILQFVGNSKQSTYAQFKEDLDAGNIQAVYFNTGYSVNVVKETPKQLPATMRQSITTISSISDRICTPLFMN